MKHRERLTLLEMGAEGWASKFIFRHLQVKFSKASV